MTCPNLSYRITDGEVEFDTERAYCEVTEKFVSPMRADICNDRHELSHERDCEYYRETEEVEH